MPYKNPNNYWTVRLPRTFQERMKKQAKLLGFPNATLLTFAVDNWLKDKENAQNRTLDKT